MDSQDSRLLRDFALAGARDGPAPAGQPRPEAGDLAQGFLGPVPLLTAAECRLVLDAVRDPGAAAPLDWSKGHAPTSRALYEVARHPEIVATVTGLLGHDVLLWGASVERREPGARHPWHTDIEVAASQGRAVSVWIGLAHTPRASLTVVPGSHRYGITVQEARGAHGRARTATTNADILAWARAHDPHAGLRELEMTDGEALFFDGRLWHGSHSRARQTRYALLLQYAAADLAIRMPDFNHLDWPFRLLDTPRPACVMIHGRARDGINRIVSPPAPEPATGVRLGHRVHPLDLPLAADAETGWKPYHLFAGRTAQVGHLTCHVSALDPGRSPHPPHRHDEEELLLLLAGEATLALPEHPGGGLRLRAGEGVYYPAQYPHTLEATGPTAANYLMFKWRTALAAHPPGALGFRHVVPFAAAEGGTAQGFRTRGLLEGPTAWLATLECHASTLAPDAGYAAHVDAHDVAIVLLEGEIETLGQTIGAPAVVLHPAGELHGIRNPGTVTARYVVLELHGRGGHLRRRLGPLLALARKLRDPQRWRRRLARLWRQARGAGGR